MKLASESKISLDDGSRPLAGQSALVTGASRGIGAHIATRLAAAGARVALLARNRAVLEERAAEIGNGAFAVECDISDADSVEKAVGVVRAKFGGVPDAVINNAGIFTIRAIEETSAEEFSSMVTTNLVAPFLLVRSFLGEMRSRGSGDIVTIGSIADREIYPGNAAYSATKYGARAMHEVLRAETRGSGVRAILVSPASVDTDVWEPIQYLGTHERPDRSRMLAAAAVANAVIYALMQPRDVNIDELRLSRS